MWNIQRTDNLLNATSRDCMQRCWRKCTLKTHQVAKNTRLRQQKLQSVQLSTYNHIVNKLRYRYKHVSYVVTHRISHKLFLTGWGVLSCLRKHCLVSSTYPSKLQCAHVDLNNAFILKHRNCVFCEFVHLASR